MTRGNGLVVAPRQGQVLPPGLDHDFAAAIDRFDGVANQVANRACQLRLRTAHGKRLSEAVDHHVDVAALVASKTRTAFRQAGPDYAVEIDVLLHGPALAAEREEIFDGLGGTQGRGLDELDVGAHVFRGALVRLQLVETVEDEIGKRHQRAQDIVEIVRHAAGENAQCLHPFRGGQALLHAALVQHGLLHQLLVKANAFHDRRDLVAEDRVGPDPVGVVEGGHAE